MNNKGKMRSIEQILSEQSFLIQPVCGDSMMPMLDQHTDTVRLVTVKGKLSQGDLPLYRRPDGKLVLHRILSAGTSYYKTRGDNRDNIEKVPEAWIVAVMDGFYKKGKFISTSDSCYLSYVDEILKHGKSEFGINEQYTIDLYMASVNNQNPPSPPQWISWNAVWLLCKKNNIVHTVLVSVKKLENPPPEKIIKLFEQDQPYKYDNEKQFNEKKLSELRHISDKKRIRDIILCNSNSTIECIEKNKIKRMGKIKYLIRLFLPSYASMILVYPCLWRLPFLLPVLWIFRIIKALMRKESRQRTFRIFKVLKTLDK